MVRGHAKAVSQAKNQAKLADKAASAKRDGAEVSSFSRNIVPAFNSHSNEYSCVYPESAS
jgi:hypothetical protein